MSLPSNVGHGTVTGRFIDSSGANIEGRVTFSPTPKRLLNPTAEPTPVTILPKAVEVTLNDGSFTQALIATDDPDNSPAGWNYRVDFKFTGAAAESFNIEVPEGSSIDLTTVTPVSSGNGTTILRGPGVPDWSEAEDGQVIVLVDGEPAWGAGGGGGGGGAVSSVNAKTGAVVLDAADVGAAPTSHTHAIGNVTGLQGALDGKQASGSYAPASHTHTLDATTDTATRVAMTPAERTKLSGVATAATANATDAALRARSSHTGTQAISTVAGLQDDLDAKAPAHWVGTQAEYDALTTTDANRLYLIREA